MFICRAGELVSSSGRVPCEEDPCCVRPQRRNPLLAPHHSNIADGTHDLLGSVLCAETLASGVTVGGYRENAVVVD